MQLTVKARDKVRGIAVPLAGETLLTILRHLQAKVSAGEVPEPDTAKCARRQEAMQNREDEDAGRLRWKFDECAYQVMYEDEEGKMHRTTKGLRMSRQDDRGQLIAPAAFATKRIQVLRKARALWNERDKTKTTRYYEFDYLVQ